MKGIRIIILFSFIVFNIATSFAQQISRSEMITLYQSIASKNWDSSFNVASDIIQKYPNDSSDNKSITNYAAILSASGRVAQSNMSYTALREFLWQFMGKKILLPAHQVTTDTTNTINMLVLKENDAQIFATSVAKDFKVNTILSVENFEFKEPFDIHKHNGIKARCGGRIYHIEVNKYRDDIWILRLFLNEAELRKL